MQEIVRMPHLGETMEEGRIVGIYVKEGDYVKKGDLLFEVETDKTVLTVESYKEGYVRKLYVAPDDVVKVGEPVLLLTSTQDEPISEEESSVPEEEKEEKHEVVKPPTSEERIEKIPATPLAKKIAKEYGISLSDIVPGGEKIKKEDVLRYVEEKRGKKENWKVLDLPDIRRTIGKRMTQSKREAPHFYLTVSVDMTNIKETKDILHKERALSISYTDFILKALSISLLEYELLNAHFLGDNKVKIFYNVNIGIAVDRGDALLVPVLKDVAGKDMEEISKERRELIDRALNSRLLLEDTKDATFTISNLGPYNIDEFSAIINPPEVGILAIGKIHESPVYKEGTFVPRSIMKLTLSLDHRVVDGAYGARFLNKLKTLLENPILIWR